MSFCMRRVRRFDIWPDINKNVEGSGQFNKRDVIRVSSLGVFCSVFCSVGLDARHSKESINLNEKY